MRCHTSLVCEKYRSARSAILMFHGLRIVACCAAAFLANAIPALAQIEEPILLKSAEPFPVGTGSIKLDYSQEQSRSGAAAETIPEITAEAGALPRTEVILRYPLVRFTPG